MDEIILVFVAALAGVGARTLVAYLLKMAAGEIMTFDQKFIATALLSIISTLFIAMGVVIATPFPTAQSNQVLLFMTVTFGSYTNNDIENRAVTALSALKKS